MKRQTKSILQELNSFSVKKDVELIIESRALNVINGAINILDMVRENFDEETALDLERRLLNSIKGGDPDKFRRGIRRISESKRANSRLARLERESPDIQMISIKMINNYNESNTELDTKQESLNG